MPQNASIKNFEWSDLPEWTALVNDLDGTSGACIETPVDYKRLLLSPAVGRRGGELFCGGGPPASVPAWRASRLSRSSAARSPRSQCCPSTAGGGFGRQLLDKVIERVGVLGLPLLHIQVSVHSRGGRFLLEDSGFYAVRRYWRLTAESDGIEVPPMPPHYSIRPV